MKLLVWECPIHGPIHGSLHAPASGTPFQQRGREAWPRGCVKTKLVGTWCPDKDGAACSKQSVLRRRPCRWLDSMWAERPGPGSMPSRHRPQWAGCQSPGQATCSRSCRWRKESFCVFSPANRSFHVPFGAEAGIRVHRRLQAAHHHHRPSVGHHFHPSSNSKISKLKSKRTRYDGRGRQNPEAGPEVPPSPTLSWARLRRACRCREGPLTSVGIIGRADRGR